MEDKINKASTRLVNESTKRVITKALEYNVLPGEISDYSTSDYEYLIRIIFNEYQGELSTILQRSLVFEKLAGNKSLASLIESKTIKSNKKVKNIFLIIEWFTRPF